MKKGKTMSDSITVRCAFSNYCFVWLWTISKKQYLKMTITLPCICGKNRLMKNIVPYIHEQFPDQDIEFITGNNDTDLYSYFEEHGELPDIITVRRFSGGRCTESTAVSYGFLFI